MTTLSLRGRKPTDWVMSVNGVGYTAADVRESRKQWQKQRLESICRPAEFPKPFRPCFVWVAYFDQRLMGGWHAFVKDRHREIWINRDAKWLKEPLMKLVHIGRLFFTWEDWMSAFAKAYQHKRHDRRPQGRLLLEWNGTEIRKRAATC